MKTLAVVCSVSVAANLALAGVLLSKANSPARASGDARVRQTTGTTAVANTGTASAESKAAPLDAEFWKSVSGGSPADLIARLRAAGVPPSYIKAIVGRMLQDKYDVRRKQVLAAQKDLPFWEGGSFRYDYKTAAAMREVSREQRKEMRDLLGSQNLDLGPEGEAYIRTQFGDLDRSKFEDVQAILADYGDLRNEIYAKANGMLLPDDKAKLALLQKEQATDLQALLTPDEWNNYELRSSDTANALRSNLGVFKPTEQEFRALYAAMRAAENQLGVIPNDLWLGENAAKTRDIMLAQLQGQISPERLEQLKQAADPQYFFMNRLVARLDLPASAAVDAVSIQQDILRRAGTIRTAPNQTPEQINAALNALATEATTRLTGTLTDRGFQAYQQYAGMWLAQLKRPVPPRPPRPPTN